MSTSDNCKDGVSKSNNDDVCDVNDMLQNMSTDDENVVSKYVPIVVKKVEVMTI